MKILWLSHLIPYPPKGGVLQRSYNLIRELAKYHELDLLAFNQRGLIGNLFPTVEQGIAEADVALGQICKRHRFFEIPTETQPGGKYRLALKSLITAPYNINWLTSDEFSDAIRHWTSDKHYDLIHFDTISLAPFLKDIPGNTATALDHHNIESHMLLRRSENEKNLLKKFYYLQEGIRLQAYEKKYCPRFSLNITCSDVDTERLRQISPASKVETVPNGVDTDYFKPGVETPGLKLVFVGRLNWYPNRQAANFIATELWPALKQKWPDIQFDLAGSNPPESACKLAQQDPNFRVHGFVDDMRPLVTAATAYVCPISDGGGTKLKILDALALGKTIVAHPVACEGIAVTPNKDVLLATSVADYITQLTRIFDNLTYREELALAARKLAEDCYSYSSIGKSTSHLYQAAADRVPVTGTPK